MLDEVKVESSFNKEDEGGNVFSSDGEEAEDFVELNEGYPGSKPDESDSDDRPKQPQRKK